jgi:enoyl-CoA hydratase/carnithine racemase
MGKVVRQGPVASLCPSMPAVPWAGSNRLCLLRDQGAGSGARTARKHCGACVTHETARTRRSARTNVALGNAPLAVQLAKDAARAAHETSLAQGLPHKRRKFFLRIDTENMREGGDACIEERRPTFIGR